MNMCPSSSYIENIKTESFDLEMEDIALKKEVIEKIGTETSNVKIFKEEHLAHVDYPCDICDENIKIESSNLETENIAKKNLGNKYEEVAKKEDLNNCVDDDTSNKFQAVYVAVKAGPSSIICSDNIKIEITEDLVDMLDPLVNLEDVRSDIKTEDTAKENLDSEYEFARNKYLNNHLDDDISNKFGTEPPIVMCSDDIKIEIHEDLVDTIDPLIKLEDIKRDIGQNNKDNFSDKCKPVQDSSMDCGKISSSENKIIRRLNSNNGRTSSENTGGGKKYTCDVCNKLFVTPSKLARHKRTHTGEKPYACEICKKCFTQLDNLYNHKRTHSGVKPYACDVCNKTFTLSNTLVNHMRTHTGEKPYVCEKCNKVFTYLSNLLRHKRIHSNEMPYTCDLCNKTFSHSGSLATHKCTHIGD